MVNEQRIWKKGKWKEITNQNKKMKLTIEIVCQVTPVAVLHHEVHTLGGLLQYMYCQHVTVQM